jgi:adenylate cyclase
MSRSARDHIERVFFDEEHRAERIITWFRAGIWTVVGLGTLAFDHRHGAGPSIGGVATTAWGVSCLVLGLAVLRRHYHRGLTAALITIDFAMLTIAHHFVFERYRIYAPALLPHQLDRNSMGVMMLLAANAMRMSWRLTLWSALLAAACHTYVLSLHHMLEPAAYQGYVLIACATAVMLHVGRRSRLVVLRVQERNALARFLPGPIVERLAENPGALDLGGKEQEVTVLFADIRDFTAISQAMKPAEVVDMLNEYFAEMVEEVFGWNGVLDKFIGDGICAVFGPHGGAGGDQAARALRCAAGMLDRLERLNVRRVARGEPPLRIGIGLHSGQVLAGNVGSPMRMEYTHIGDVVNTASRIEGLTKELKESILISAETYDRAGGERAIAARCLPPVTVKGKSEPLAIFAVDAAAVVRPGDPVNDPLAGGRTRPAPSAAG